MDKLRLALLSFLVAGLCLLLPGCAGSDIGTEIRGNYEAHLSSLPLSERKHFALRMYRISGAERYLPTIMADARRDAMALRRDIDNLDDQDYRRARAARIVDHYPDNTEKNRRRKMLLAGSGESAFAKSLLHDVYQAEDLGLIGQPPLQDIESALTYLRQIDWSGFWLAPETMKIYTAQSVNQIYYLYHLGIDDLRAELRQAFRNSFPDAMDDELSELEYQNKIYGLTHFIIAASDYYQQFVDRSEFVWIYAYFEHNIERILTRGKADIHAEVALCFLLAGERAHPVVRRVKQVLEAEYDPKALLIPSVETGTNLEHGEHRNTLASMIYAWPQTLHKGPRLSLQ